MTDQTGFTMLSVKGASVATLERFSDRRGYFQELFRIKKYPEELLPPDGFSQISLSFSRRGVLRGLHCSKYPKLVYVTRGRIYDVIVDFRPESPTFRRWCAVIVSEENRRQIHIPAGCGHGFFCEEDAEVLYLQGGVFEPQFERDVHPFDMTLDIKWPKLEGQDYIISEKDLNAPNFLERFGNELSPEIAPWRRVLVIGASGQVGGALVEAIGSEAVVGTFSNTPVDGFVRFDMQEAVRDPKLVDDLITLCHPEIVLICAGRTWVDGCENDKDLPHAVNSECPRLIARAAKKIGAKTVYYSTDYVFKGAVPGKVYSETDQTGPVNVYGISKLEGENAVLQEDANSLVLRTTGVFGPEAQGKNFVYQLCRSVAEGRKMMCASDSYGTPTYNRDLAAMTFGLLKEGKSGIYNCVGNETLDRFSFAVVVAKTFGFDTAYIQKVDSASLYESTKTKLGFAARRGKYLGLKNEKVLACLPNVQPKSMIEALQHWKHHPRGAELFG